MKSLWLVENNDLMMEFYADTVTEISKYFFYVG